MSQNSLQTTRFLKNLKATRIIGTFLTLEQVAYGFLLSDAGTSLQHIYFFSAFALGFISLLSFFVRIPQNGKFLLRYQVLEIIPLAFGMAISIVRMLAIPGELINIPTLYLAVLYGGAVLYILNYVQSGILYGLLGLASIVFVKLNATTAAHSSIFADFAVNCIIGWIVSVLNYRSFLKDHRQMRVIEAQNKQLRYISEHDTLTGLFNRRKIDSTLVEILNQPVANLEYTSVVLFDLDHFKQINDTYGHQEGDILLKQLSKVVLSSLDSDELLGRWGGEEFLILAKHDGEELAEKLKHVIVQTEFNHVKGLSASFGVYYLQNGDSEIDVFKRVDKALYMAKQSGRNCVKVYSEEEQLIVG